MIVCLSSMIDNNQRTCLILQLEMICVALLQRKPVVVVALPRSLGKVALCQRVPVKQRKSSIILEYLMIFKHKKSIVVNLMPLRYDIDFYASCVGKEKAFPRFLQQQHNLLIVMMHDYCARALG